MIRFSFLLMLSILTLVSCGDDDNPNDSSIEGTWTLESSRSGSITDLLGTETDLALIYVSGDIEIEFKADGNFEQIGSGVYDLTTILDGDTLATQPTTLDLGQTGTYTAVNGRLEGLNANPSSTSTTANNTVTTYTIANDKLTLDLTGTIEQGAQVSQAYGTAVYQRQ